MNAFGNFLYLNNTWIKSGSVLCTRMASGMSVMSVPYICQHWVHRPFDPSPQWFLPIPGLLYRTPIPWRRSTKLSHRCSFPFRWDSKGFRAGTVCWRWWQTKPRPKWMLSASSLKGIPERGRTKIRIPPWQFESSWGCFCATRGLSRRCTPLKTKLN